MLIFNFGVMGSSKTANAIMTAFNMETRGLNILFVKPDLENRDGQNIVKSRIGLSRDCLLWSEFYTLTDFSKVDKIIVDEVHFLTKENIDYLAELADLYNIEIICYGLKTDFQINLFEGSKRLLEVADKIQEIEHSCWCGNKATHNARVDSNFNIIKDGAQILLGGDEKYIAVCRKHFNQNKVVKFEEF